MRKFLTLVNLEVNRIAKMFFIALSAYFAIICAWTLIQAKGTMKSIIAAAENGQMSIAKYLESVCRVPYRGDDVLRHNYALTGGAVFLLLLVAIYAFVIWYRDWFGSNKTIYSLLLLPVDRMKVFYAKALTIILMGCSVVSTFLMGVIAVFYIDKAVLDKLLIGDVTLLETFNFAMNITAYKKIDIVLLSVCMVCLIFLFVLLERSHKVKGIILAAVIAALYFASNITVLSVEWLFTGEKIFIAGIIQAVFIAVSIAYSNYLIKRKVAV